MPNKPRLDEPGAQHHVFARGIDRQDLFRDDADRERFLRITARVFSEGKTRCLAWALMPNHFHFLVETGTTPLSRVFHRINTCYAMYFNRRHDRVGYVFQGRFRSKRVDSDSYLMGLVGYVHLNPLRGGIVAGIEELEEYRWTAYSGLLGVRTARLVDVDGVLSLFGPTPEVARAELRSFLTFFPDVDPHRSRRIWPRAVDLPRRAQFDSRVFGVEGLRGRSEFLGRVSRDLELRTSRRAAAYARGWTLRQFVEVTCRRLGAVVEGVRSGRRTSRESLARAVIAWIACDHLGERATDVARETGVSHQAIERARRKGAAVVAKIGISPDELVA